MGYVIIKAIGILLFLVLLGVELYKPARHYSKDAKKVSYITNIALFAFNNATLFILQVTSVFMIVYTFQVQTIVSVLPYILQLLIGVLILDFFIWLWHVINHRVVFLWSFHKCHHSEKYLNVTSAIRFHFGELLLSIGFKSLLLVVTGIPLWVFFIHESLITLFAMFHHANIKLPFMVQQYLSWVIITPRMHRTHHSSIRIEHDSNYGVLFSWWDRLFKTYKNVTPKEIGLDGIEEKGFIKTLVYPLYDK